MTSPGPVLLRADNFTPVARTPWGGTRIARHYKHELLSAPLPDVIGESWEVSSGPEFPALLVDGTSLRDYIAGDPAGVLGREYSLGRSGTALLVKLLDTSQPLSVQIHPSDDYAGLLPGECGKPECWYVAERAEGAGLYLGFHPGVEEHDVRETLEQGLSLEPLMRYFPVEPGDFFTIDAGMPHAIGAGITLVEPQHVLPGRRGVTYRYWDWNRRYDAAGAPSAQGAPRPLHVEDALAVTDWARFQRPNFVDDIRLRSAPTKLRAAPAILTLSGAGALPSSYLAVSRLSGTGPAALPYRNCLQSITVLEGTVSVSGLPVTRGRSAVVPACAADFPLTLEAAHAIVCAVA